VFFRLSSNGDKATNGVSSRSIFSGVVRCTRSLYSSAGAALLLLTRISSIPITQNVYFYDTDTNDENTTDEIVPTWLRWTDTEEKNNEKDIFVERADLEWSHDERRAVVPGVSSPVGIEFGAPDPSKWDVDFVRRLLVSQRQDDEFYLKCFFYAVADRSVGSAMQADPTLTLTEARTQLARFCDISYETNVNSVTTTTQEENDLVFQAARSTSALSVLRHPRSNIAIWAASCNIDEAIDFYLDRDFANDLSLNNTTASVAVVGEKTDAPPEAAFDCTSYVFNNSSSYWILGDFFLCCQRLDALSRKQCHSFLFSGDNGEPSSVLDDEQLLAVVETRAFTRFAATSAASSRAVNSAYVSGKGERRSTDPVVAALAKKAREAAKTLVEKLPKNTNPYHSANIRRVKWGVCYCSLKKKDAATTTCNHDMPPLENFLVFYTLMLRINYARALLKEHSAVGGGGNATRMSATTKSRLEYFRRANERFLSTLLQTSPTKTVFTDSHVLSRGTSMAMVQTLYPFLNDGNDDESCALRCEDYEVFDGVVRTYRRYPTPREHLNRVFPDNLSFERLLQSSATDDDKPDTLGGASHEVALFDVLSDATTKTSIVIENLIDAKDSVWKSEDDKKLEHCRVMLARYSKIFASVSSTENGVDVLRALVQSDFRDACSFVRSIVSNVDSVEVVRLLFDAHHNKGEKFFDATFGPSAKREHLHNMAMIAKMTIATTIALRVNIAEFLTVLLSSNGDSGGETSYQLACFANTHLDLVEYMIEHGCFTDELLMSTEGVGNVYETRLMPVFEWLYPHDDRSIGEGDAPDYSDRLDYVNFFTGSKPFESLPWAHMILKRFPKVCKARLTDEVNESKCAESDAYYHWNAMCLYLSLMGAYRHCSERPSFWRRLRLHAFLQKAGHSASTPAQKSTLMTFMRGNKMLVGSCVREQVTYLMRRGNPVLWDVLREPYHLDRFDLLTRVQCDTVRATYAATGELGSSCAIFMGVDAVVRVGVHKLSMFARDALRRSLSVTNSSSSSAKKPALPKSVSSSSSTIVGTAKKVDQKKKRTSHSDVFRSRRCDFPTFMCDLLAHYESLRFLRGQWRPVRDRVPRLKRMLLHMHVESLTPNAARGKAPSDDGDTETSGGNGECGGGGGASFALPNRNERGRLDRFDDGFAVLTRLGASEATVILLRKLKSMYGESLNEAYGCYTLDIIYRRWPEDYSLIYLYFHALYSHSRIRLVELHNASLIEQQLRALCRRHEIASVAELPENAGSFAFAPCCRMTKTLLANGRVTRPTGTWRILKNVVENRYVCARKCDKSEILAQKALAAAGAESDRVIASAAKRRRRMNPDAALEAVATTIAEADDDAITTATENNDEDDDDEDPLDFSKDGQIVHRAIAYVEQHRTSFSVGGGGDGDAETTEAVRIARAFYEEFFLLKRFQEEEIDERTRTTITRVGRRETNASMPCATTDVIFVPLIGRVLEFIDYKEVIKRKCSEELPIWINPCCGQFDYYLQVNWGANGYVCETCRRISTDPGGIAHSSNLALTRTTGCELCGAWKHQPVKTLFLLDDDRGGSCGVRQFAACRTCSSVVARLAAASLFDIQQKHPIDAMARLSQVRAEVTGNLFGSTVTTTRSSTAKRGRGARRPSANKK
jgi:hypothetical protein